MKKLFRKLRQRNHADSEECATSNAMNSAREDEISSTGREFTSNTKTQPKSSPEAASIGRGDTDRSLALASSVPKQDERVHNSPIDRSEVQQGKRPSVEPRSGLTSSSTAAASQYNSSNLLTPERVLPVTQTRQRSAPGVPSALVKSLAYNKNANKIEGTMQVQITSNCSTCCCLDARRTTSDKQDAWASREYNVAAEVPSRKLSIKHTQLLASSASGCIYCILVSKSLGVVRPGWESEESFIELFLSPNLPVVVRWIKGSNFVTEPSWEEAFGGFIQHEIKLKIANPSGIVEPDVELEIYRPEALQEMSVSNLALARLVSHIGVARELASHTGALECFKFISDQATACLQQHSCGSRMPLLPDRVIWVKPDNTGEIRLMEPKNVHAQYIALSYCWGPVRPDTFLTNAATLADRKAGIKADDLPRLFVCIINCARMLRIDYIWIDRLCIIQGDDEDFARQAPKMGQYYGNATITFAAASASSEMDDILVDRDKKWSSTALNVQVDQLGSMELRFRQRQYPLGTEAQGGDYGKVSSRAWIWQERLLAARTIFFTPAALKFECHRHSIWEGSNRSVTSPSWSSRLDKMTQQDWLTLVEEFTRRDITRSSDRLPAISSVMQRISNAHGWVPTWGMWSEFVDKSLAWSVNDAGDWSGKHRCSVHPKYYAPSWSWASINGPVDFGHCRPLEEFEEADRYRNSIKVSNIDQASGVLTVLGHWNFALIRCRVERPYTTPAIRYYYECTTVRQTFENDSPDRPGETPVMADVALQPVKRKLSLLEDGTIMRVPYGVSPPQKTWTSKCLCIMLGYRPMRATVLLLGESQRIPGAYERIGLAAGWPPEMFTANDQLSFKIT